MRQDLKIADSMLELIGGIPLVRLNRVGRDLQAEFLVKPEFLNPSGSIKDRVARRVVARAEREGQLSPGGTVVESSTGNTGAALAFVCAVKGYRAAIQLPSTSSRARQAIVRAFGAEVTVFDVDSSEENGVAPDVPRSLRGRARCRALARERDDVWWARQFANLDCVAAHREETAREILDQTDGQLDVFVASVSGGSTLLGIGVALKEHDPSITVIAVQPTAHRVLDVERAGAPGLSGGILDALVEAGVIDEVVSLDDAPAIAMAHRLAEEEGIFCGVSSGANVVASLAAARRARPGARIVTVLPDSRDRYLDEEAYVT
ncbi:MAG: cysteine synthase family protein [Myxococcales bacterium]|nr:cysteine synthase family protein [Myxococcales bacterium]